MRGPSEFAKQLKSQLDEIPPISKPVALGKANNILQEHSEYHDKWESPEHLLAELASDKCESTLEAIVENIGGEGGKRIEQDVAACEFRLRTANACCGTPSQYCYTFWNRCGPLCQAISSRTLPECCTRGCSEFRGVIIGIHSGLFMLLHNAVELALASTDVEVSYRTGDVVSKHRKLLPPSEAISSFYSLLVKERDGEIPALPPMVTLDRPRRNILILVEIYGSMFVLAHELAHFLLHHVPTQDLGLCEIGQADGISHRWSRSQEEEFRADETAFALLLNTNWCRSDFAIMCAIAGTEAIFWVLELRERIVQSSRNPSHPDAKSRGSNLRKKFQWPESYYCIANTVVSCGEHDLWEGVKKR